MFSGSPLFCCWPWECQTACRAAEPAASELLGSANFRPTSLHPVGWRGDGTGHYPAQNPPTVWARTQTDSGYATKGIVWVAQMPNKSVSSPIVVGDRIFLTTEVADLVCVNKKSGRILWIRSNPEFDGLSEDVRKAIPSRPTN